MDAEAHRLFDRWVIVPFSALRQLPNGDGAFAALAIAFGLYERYIISQIHKRGGSADAKERNNEASMDFGGAVSPEDFESFWDMYRVGVQHYFHPKHFTKGKDKTRWCWDISENKGYTGHPKVIQTEADLFIITIDPWLFVEHTLNRWYQHPELMNELSATTFGRIQERHDAPRPVPPAPVHSILQATGTGDAIFSQTGGTGICPPKP